MPARVAARRRRISSKRSSVAADAKTTKALELPVTVEHGQTRHLDGQTLVDMIGRPKQDDTAESFSRRERVGDLALRIEIQGLGNLNPIAVKSSSSFRSEQIGEFLACKTKAILSIGLPDKSEGYTI